jgi:hypothetical protein
MSLLTIRRLKYSIIIEYFILKDDNNLNKQVNTTVQHNIFLL